MKKYPGSMILLQLIVAFAIVLGYHSTAVRAAEALHFDSGPRQLTLVELYTSQGCSSCPPAERWISKLKADPRLWRSIIPVAFHVDYWDYLGWHDTLADASYSQRQRRYHKEGKLRTVYTPAFVVNGEEWRSWFGLRQLPESTTKPGSLSVTVERTRLHASFTAATAPLTPLQLNVAILGMDIRESIAAGENRGHTLTQDFAVLTLQHKMSDTGNWVLPLTLPYRHGNKRLALAVWVSRPHVQGPIQATGGWLPASYFANSQEQK